MPLTKAKKAEKVTQLAHELEGSTSAIIGTFAKLTVAQDFELRKTVRAAGGRYRVLKNKLAARAAQGSKIGAALQGLKGVSSVAYTSGDPVALAKALSTWVGDNAEFTFKLGIIDGKVITVEEVKQLATMPGKEELFAKLLFLINSPAQRLATVINATGRDLAVVINQAVEKNKFAGAQAPAAAEQAPVAEQAQAAETPAVVAEPVAAAEPAEPEVPVVEQAQVAETPAAVAEPAAAAAPEVSGGEAEAHAAE
jgi:large subunit ribosomal protein L10